MCIAHISKLCFILLLICLCLIFRAPDTKHTRVGGKFFPPLHMLNKKENGRKEIYQHANIGYVTCSTFKQKKSLVKAAFCMDSKLTEQQHLYCYKQISFRC